MDMNGYIVQEIKNLNEERTANKDYLKSSQEVYADKIKNKLGEEIKHDLAEFNKPPKTNKIKQFFIKLFSIYG